jgi:hypothetical protein
MFRVRHLLMSAALAAAVAACGQSPLGSAVTPISPRLDAVGQTLGSGHRDGDTGSTTATASGTSVAGDSLTSSAYGGQTLGSGH